MENIVWCLSCATGLSPKTKSLRTKASFVPREHVPAHHEWWGQTGLRDCACALWIPTAGDEQLSANPCSPSRLGSWAVEDAKYWKGSSTHEVLTTRRQCFAPLLQHFSSSLAIWVDTRHQACLWNAAQHIRPHPGAQRGWQLLWLLKHKQSSWGLWTEVAVS